VGGGSSDGGKNVDDATAADFVGTFRATDAGRPGYRATFVFHAGGTCSLTEVYGGITLSGNVFWAFNEATNVLSVTAPGGGRAAGVVSGTVDDFMLRGTYANGDPANLHMVRG